MAYVAVPQVILSFTNILPSDTQMAMGRGKDLERQAQLPVQISLLYAVNMFLRLHLTTSMVILTVPEDLV